MRILQTWLEQQCDRLRSQQPPFINDPSYTCVAAIVEPRRHPHLEAVIRNIMFHVGPKWNLHVYTSDDNIQWLKSLFPESNFRISSLPYKNMTRTLYNELLMDPLFWHSFHEDHILVFQTDTMMFRKTIDHFLNQNYDYIGPNYYHPNDTAPTIGGIQGGFSLRRRSAMIDCCKLSWNTIMDYRMASKMPYSPREWNEDIYFTHACEMLGKKIASSDERQAFAIEADFNADTMAMHGWNKPYLTENQQRELISQHEHCINSSKT